MFSSHPFAQMKSEPFLNPTKGQQNALPRPSSSYFKYILRKESEYLKVRGKQKQG